MTLPTLGPDPTWWRWMIIATMLLIALAWSGSGSMGYPLWVAVLIFGGYNLLVEVARRYILALQSYSWVPALDLPAAALLYYNDSGPAGPLFVGFYLAVLTAAISLPLRLTLIYLLLTVATIVVIVPTFPDWSGSPAQFRQLAVRLVVLVMLGLGMALFSRRLVTHQEVARTLSREAERLEELDRLRANFLASVSHDLKTPLTALQAGLGMVAMSARERLLPVERDVLEHARGSTERLTTLIEDLLLVNQLRTRTLRLERVELDLRDVVSRAIADIEPLLTQKQQVLTVDLPIPLPVLGDPGRLVQVVVNLLANANRHTGTGTNIAVSGKVADDEVRLIVTDDGPGIPAAELDNVFVRFYQLDPERGGSGLGLANSRDVVELHGGRIWVQSRPGATAFIVALPAGEG